VNYSWARFENLFLNPAIPTNPDITALNHDGNESDMVKFTVNFDSPVQGVPAGLLRPGAEGWEPPIRASVLVDDLHFWLIRNPSIQEPGQSDDTRDYYAESHHVEEAHR
jgi:hypothetical protein